MQSRLAGPKQGAEFCHGSFIKSALVFGGENKVWGPQMIMQCSTRQSKTLVEGEADEQHEEQATEMDLRDTEFRAETFVHSKGPITTFGQFVFKGRQRSTASVEDKLRLALESTQLAMKIS
jgi:hypothetical protein